MSTIRRQAIISSALIYIGFLFGALNTFLFTKQGLFTPEQYGLTRAMITIGQFFYGFAGFGLTALAYKFYPYYKDHLPAEKNDLLTIMLVGSGLGFLLTLSGGLLFENVVVQKFVAKAPLLLTYYYYVFPFTFFLLFFSMLEAYAWSGGHTIVPNFLKEAGFRISTTLLIGLFLITGKNFELFIRLFSFVYAISSVILALYLIRLKEFRIVFQVSKVSKRFYKKMLSLMGLIYAGNAINITAQSVDFLTIASKIGLQWGAVFDFSSYLASVIQVPQRSLAAISISVLSRAWKEKDYGTIDRVYERSSLNLLLISLFIFSAIWLNYEHAVRVLGLNPLYLEGRWVVFLLGMKNIVDMGTGVNSQIIGTSTFWRFEFLSGMLLLSLLIPLNIYLVTEIGILGAALSNLIAYILYNLIRIIFLYRKFGMQPFTMQTVKVLVHAAACFLIIFYGFNWWEGWSGLVVRSFAYTLLFAGTAALFRLTPDIEPILVTVRKRLGLRK